MDPIRLVDLFAGIGGIRQGFVDAARELDHHEPECVFTSEWDKFAVQTYKANFGDEDVHGDIMDPEVQAEIPRGGFDVLLAGFPCQPFSLAGVSKKNSLGRPHGFADPTQGTLFHEIVEILRPDEDGWQPDAFLLENVKHLLNHDKGRTFEVISDALDSLGYVWRAEVVSAAHFVPQGRERIYFVGYHESLGLDAFDFESALGLDERPELAVGPILHEGRDERDLIDMFWTRDHGTLADYTLSDKLWTYLKDYAAKHRRNGNGFGYGLIEKDRPTRTLSARYHKDGSEILVPVEGAATDADGLPTHVRRLTPRECARLQGFPEEFRIVCSDTQAYRQFGNSVAVPVIAAIAERMLVDLEGARRTIDVREAVAA